MNLHIKAVDFIVCEYYLNFFKWLKTKTKMCRLQLRLRAPQTVCLSFSLLSCEWSGLDMLSFQRLSAILYLPVFKHWRRLTDALMAYWYASSFLEAQHFVNHLIQVFSNYAPDSICPGLGSSHSKPGKSWANSDNWSPNLLQSSEQWVKGLWSPVPTLVPTNSTASLFLSFFT